MIKELKCFESKLQSTAAHQDKKEIQQHSNTGAKIIATETAREHFQLVSI
jgi:hypothetical protein